MILRWEVIEVGDRGRPDAPPVAVLAASRREAETRALEAGLRPPFAVRATPVLVAKSDGTVAPAEHAAEAEAAARYGLPVDGRRAVPVRDEVALAGARAVSALGAAPACPHPGAFSQTRGSTSFERLNAYNPDRQEPRERGELFGMAEYRSVLKFPTGGI